MQKKVLLPLVLLFSQVLADSVDFGNVCSVPKPDDHEAVTVLQGISGALLPFVVAQPEFGVPAELLVQGLNSAVSIWSWITDQNSDDDQDSYTDKLMECLKTWVDAEIDESFWRQATSWHGQTGVTLGRLAEELNATTTTAETPRKALKEAERYYDDIDGYMKNVQSLYKGLNGKTKTVVAEMLQMHLDLVSIRSHTGLTMSLYASANSLDGFNYAYYMKDVEDLIENEFGYDNDELSIQLIFDQSPTTTDWHGEIQNYYQDCGGVIFTACGHHDSICKITDKFRNNKELFKCQKECLFWNSWSWKNDACTEKCKKSECNDQWQAGYDYVTKSLAATKSHIDDGKKLQQEILTRMQNLQK